MPDPHQRAFLRRLQLPSHARFEIARPTRHPRVHEQPRSIDLHILAARFKPVAVRTHALTFPFPTRAQLTLVFRALVHAFLSPPLDQLHRIDQRLKHTLGGRSDVNFALNGIRIGNTFRSGRGAAPLHKAPQLIDQPSPAFAVVKPRHLFLRQPAVRHLHPCSTRDGRQLPSHHRR